MSHGRRHRDQVYPRFRNLQGHIVEVRQLSVATHLEIQRQQLEEIRRERARLRADRRILRDQLFSAQLELGWLLERWPVRFLRWLRILPVFVEPPGPPEPDPAAGVCRLCGCTEDRACPGGCGWASAGRTECTACVPPTGASEDVASATPVAGRTSS